MVCTIEFPLNYTSLLVMNEQTSIRSQILRLVLGSVFVTLVLALCYTGFEFHDTIRSARVREATATALLLSENATVTVSFSDPSGATGDLESLSVMPSAKGAVVLDEEGNYASRYGVFDEENCPHDATRYRNINELHTEFHGSFLHVAIPLQEGDERLGVLVTVTDTSDIQTRFYSTITSLLLVSGVLIAIVLIIAVRLVNNLVGPILDLTNVAREVSVSQDYSLRVNTHGEGETRTLCRQFNDMLSHIESSNVQVKLTKEELYHVNESLERRVVDRTRALEAANNRLTEENTKREEALMELTKVQSQLVESSRAAGMAEIANGVLHNIGNVLNSVKVSASMATTKISGLKITPISRTASLLKEKKQTMGDEWVTFDGLEYVPDLLDELGKSLEASQTATVEELRELDQNIKFIEEILRSQQNHARSPGVKERVQADEIFDTSLKLVSSGKRFAGMDVTRDYQFCDEVPLDKNRVMQILSNFIKTGFEAMDRTPPDQIVLHLSISQPKPDWVRFSVKDNGHGIPPERLSNLFTYGFTTKKTGHGFGLHSAACAAREMGGEIHIESEGEKMGATFSLDLPLLPVESPAEPAESVPEQTALV